MEYGEPLPKEYQTKGYYEVPSLTAMGYSESPTTTYRGGETFRFRGDDDVWVFIDGKRVIDLGGTHSAEDAQVALDTLSLARGRSYPLDFFFAERHTVDSNLLIETTIVFDEFQPPR